MKKILLLCSLFVSAVYAQELETFQLVPESDLIVTQAGRRISYGFKNYVFEVYGKQLKIRCNRKLILTDEGTDDISVMVPHLFITPDTADIMVLMTDIKYEALSGFNLYLLKGTEAKPIGFFPVVIIVPRSAADEEDFHISSLAENIVIQHSNKDVYISFDAAKVALRPGTNREKIVNGDEVKFHYNGKKLKEVAGF